ncbi:MAG: entericidin EcnA/B family protein [Pseudomonadota bacterium]|nr:entericidin EcnA/B family protein [Pseudomonadota bacterium]
MRKFVTLLAAAAVLSTAACNTVRGAARDTEAAADKVDEAVTGDPK